MFTDRLTADIWDDFTLFLLRISTWSLNNSCSWYVELQLCFRLCTIICHGYAGIASRKLVVRLGFGLSERTESRRQWPTPAEHARRVSATTAARHQRPAHRGQGRPTRAINPASACPSHPAPIFNFLASSFAHSAAAELPQRRAVPPSSRVHCIAPPPPPSLP